MSIARTPIEGAIQVIAAPAFLANAIFGRSGRHQNNVSYWGLKLRDPFHISKA